MAIEWDRPFLYALVGLPDGRRLHLINVHLRAPRAAFMPGLLEAVRRVGRHPGLTVGLEHYLDLG